MSQIHTDGLSVVPIAQRALNAWFAPKRFESTALYERLGVLLVKQYAQPAAFSSFAATARADCRREEQPELLGAI